MKKKWIAPKGKIWVCMACGKTSDIKSGGVGAMMHWDVSCFLNAILIEESKIVRSSSGYVVEIKE